MEYLKNAKELIQNKLSKFEDNFDKLFENQNADDINKEISNIKNNANKFYKDNKTYINMGLIAVGTAIFMKLILKPSVVIIHK